jgi:hypothetical protein
MVYVCSSEKWKQLGQPDLNSVIYLRDRKTSKKVYFIVIAIDYGHKKGIKMNLLKTK